ncbi:MAG: hypothetical protein B6I28_02500 [Fusobacteriia bacterium 4572_132]|nr:MAG: hypothetical protein B6I28_02500 [Fusobacteriia bacterium 4572_132]
MDFDKMKEMNALALAYFGDAVWEMAVREYYVNKNLKVKDLNNKVRRFVEGKSQSKIYLELEKEFDEKAMSVARRAKNSKMNYPKSCTIKEYKNATAFEAVIAYYYYNDSKKISEIIKKYIVEGGKNEK